MRSVGKRLRAEEWLQWHREDWGGAAIPTEPPATVVMGAANRLAKSAVQQWLRKPHDGLWGCLIAIVTCPLQTGPAGV
ncbi:hypothetical protein DM47_1508 [Burkholderia mallei]|nr:hypothetical protein DM75_2334 [Burkholderia mallei]KOS74251.1 hypothetical protein DM46_1112 [Burkholderia mallei]KOS89784.1 hypothetical protein DM53_3907 [Burkholderia mallei]KOS90941.1 hypothetical protein DM45_2327 [Burkholderia mallei]KOS94268.1 hypothetical protein DM49_1894 [Burkholderia mallei]